MNKIIILFSTFLLFSSFTPVKKLNKGRVLFYNEKGFGHIAGQNKEVFFVYESGLIDEVYKGDIVAFLSVDTKKGLEAYDVKLLKKIK